MAEDTVSGGTASVEIEAVISLNEQSVAEAKAKLAQELGGSDTSTPEGKRAGRGRVQNGGTTTTAAVDAKVKTKLEGQISKDIQAAIDKDEYQLTIDTLSIRNQIAQALKAPFDIVVNAEIHGIAGAAGAHEGLGVAHGATVATGAAPSAQPHPEELVKALKPQMRDAIDNLYRNIQEAFNAAGRTFGRQSSAPGNQIEKAAEIMSQFGTKFDDLLQVKGPVNKAVGGSLSPKELGAMLGLPPTHPSIQAVNANTLGLASQGPNGLTSRSIDVFFSRLKKWSEAGGGIQAAYDTGDVHTGQALNVATGVMRGGTVESGGAMLPDDSAAKQRALAAREEAEKASKEVIADRQRSLRFSPIDASGLTGLPNTDKGTRRLRGRDANGNPLYGPDIPGFIGPTLPGLSFPETPATGEDIDADERARRQLGNDRANVRRRRGRVGNQHVGGLALNLEPFLRLAEMGRFQDVFEQFTGKGFNDSQGFGQLVPEDAGGFAELQRLKGGKPGVKRHIAGQEGKFQALRPSEAFARTVLAATGADSDNATMEAVRSFLESPEVADSIKKALDRGGAPLGGTSGATKRGQGAPKIGTGASDLGAQAKRLFEFIDYLDNSITQTSAQLADVDRSIDALQGSGVSTKALDKTAAGLHQQITQLNKRKADATAELAAVNGEGGGEGTAVMRAAAKARGERAGGQSDVQRLGIGLTAAERATSDTGIFGPAKTGKRLASMAEANELPSQEAMVSALIGRYFDNKSRVDPATGQSLRGQQTLRQAAFGPTGRAVKQKGDEDAGLFGELVGSLPADLGPTAKREAAAYIRDTLTAVVQDQSFKAQLTETDVARREPMARPVGKQRTTSSALMGLEDIIDPATGLMRPPETISFGTNVSGEGQYTGLAPGAEGRVRGMIERNRKIKEARENGSLDALKAKRARAMPGQNRDAIDSQIAELEPGPNSEYPYSDPDQMQAELESLKSKLAAVAGGEDSAARARQKTLGKATPLSGDASRDIARDTGMFMEEEVRHAPFEQFNAAYGQPEGPGYERLAASYGAARPSGAVGAGAGGGGGEEGKTDLSGASGIVSVNVMNWTVLAALLDAHMNVRASKGGGGGGDEQGPPKDTTPKAAKAAPEPKSKRRKNITTKDIGTVADTGRIYTFEPEGINQEEAHEPGFGPEFKGSQSYHGRTPGTEGRQTIRSTQASVPTTPAERHFLNMLERANKPATDARGIIGTPSRDRAIEEARRGGVDLNINDVRGVSGELTAPPSETVLRANAARSRAQRSLPQRAIGTSVIQIAENLFGGLEGPQQRLAILANRSSDVERLGTIAGRQQQGRRGIIGEQLQLRAAARQVEAGGGDATQIRARMAGLGNEFLALTKQSRLTNAALKQGAEEVEVLAKSAVTGSDILRNLAAGAVGGVAGGLATGVIAQAIGGVTQVAQQVLGPIGERLGGFGATTGRVQEQTATNFRAANDDLAATLAQTGITARLSDDQLAAISGPLGQRTQTVAGTQALAAQQDLVRSAGNIGANQYDRALTRSTGGLFDVSIPTYLPVGDVSIGGQASTAETLASSIRDLAGPKDIANQTQNDPVADFIFGADKRRSEGNAAAEKLLASNTTQLKVLNDNLKGSKFSLTPTTDQDALGRQQAAFKAVGATSLGEALKDKGILAQGTQSGNASDVLEFLKTFNKGPDLSPKQALQLDSRAIQAQIQSEDAQRQFTLQTVNPQTFAIGEAANPLAPAKTGINTSGVSAAEQKKINAELGQTQKLYDGINADVQTGIAAAKDFVSGTLGGEAGKEFATSLDHVAEIGKEISGIQIGLQTKQAAYSAAQFSYQIDLAKRSLKDAKELVSGVGNGLGAVERQMFDLQRESQALSLGQTQKQINFQTAVASFQSPGLTSEEREARKEEAKLEADYAQKQLDIQKKLFSLGGRQFSITASRQVRDLVRQIGLLEKGRTLSLETASAEKKILALTKIQAKENKQVETFYQSAVQRTGDVQSEIQKLVAATGKSMTEVGTLVLKEFRNTYQGMIDVITTGASGDPHSNDQIGAGGGADRHTGKGPGQAGGFLGTVSGSTALGKLGVIGESAGEAVAILKNPQQIVSPMGGGGGGVQQFIVNVYNPVVKSDDDKRKLIADVKKAIQAEARLLLPRGA